MTDRTASVRSIGSARRRHRTRERVWREALAEAAAVIADALAGDMALDAGACNAHRILGRVVVDCCKNGALE